MKKLLLILTLFSLKGFSQPATPTGFTFINQKYDWLEGKFRTLHVPSGGATQTLYGGWTGAGALYWDSVGKVLSVWDGAAWRTVGGGGSSTFVGLSDGPGAFTGKSLNLVRVNAGETALEYRTPSNVLSDIGAQASLVSGTNIKTIDGNSILGSGNYINDYSMQAYVALGDTTKGQTVGKSLSDGPVSTVNLGDGIGRTVPIWIPQTCTIYGFRWFQTVTGNYTSDNYNGAGLYSYSGGNLTLMGSSTDDGNIWKATGNAWTNKAFSSPIVISTPGLYFLMFVYNSSAQTTAPGIAAPSTLNNANTASYFFTNSAKMFGSLSIATLPSPTQAMSGVNAANQVFYFSLY